LLSDVFLLLRLERQLNENLLKLLVDVVNAKLFERVILTSVSADMLYLCFRCHTSKISKPKISYIDWMSAVAVFWKETPTKIPITCAKAALGFIDILILETIHSNRLL